MFGADESRLDEMVSPMRCRQVLFRSDRDYASRIDVVVGDVVVPLDMGEIHSVGNSIGLVEVFEIAEEVGVVSDSSKVTFEMPIVHDVESYQGDKEPPVCFHDLRSV